MSWKKGKMIKWEKWDNKEECSSLIFYPNITIFSLNPSDFDKLPLKKLGRKY